MYCLNGIHSELVCLESCVHIWFSGYISFLGSIRLSLAYHMWFPGQLFLSVNILCTFCLRGQADLCFAVRASIYHWWWSKVKTIISWIECWRQHRPVHSRLLRKDFLNEWLITSSWRMNSDDVSVGNSAAKRDDTPHPHPPASLVSSCAYEFLPTPAFSFPYLLLNKYSSAINELLQKLLTFKPMELSPPVLCARCLLSPGRLGAGPTSHNQTPCTWCSGHGRSMSTWGKSQSQLYYFPFPPTLSLFYNSSCLGNALHLDGEVN